MIANLAGKRICVCHSISLDGIRKKKQCLTVRKIHFRVYVTHFKGGTKFAIKYINDLKGQKNYLYLEKKILNMLKNIICESV